ncbi:hypothetical protein I4U23_024310 [Adineta vaga]|nr:hypothetical protein I4U23_024310 [Adineta vaga]
MSVTKRSTKKVVSYNELDDDDDDFVPIGGDNSKKNRCSKTKQITKQSTKKCEEKIFPVEPEEPVLILKPVKQPTIVTEEKEKENTTSQSSVSSDDGKPSSEIVLDVKEEDGDELLPKSKRIKHDEEDDTNENKEESLPQQLSFNEREESTSKDEILSVDHHTSRTSSSRTAELPGRRSSTPLGFPTSKINISSPHVSRVGLSRKSVTVKPLHPNLTTRVVHE